MGVTSSEGFESLPSRQSHTFVRRLARLGVCYSWKEFTTIFVAAMERSLVAKAVVGSPATMGNPIRRVRVPSLSATSFDTTWDGRLDRH